MMEEHDLKNRQASTFHLKNLKQLYAFLIASIIGSDINKIKYYNEVVKPRENKSAVKSKGAALQDLSSSVAPLYYGKSLKGISILLGCSETRACELKKMAANAGFLKVKHHFTRLMLLKKPDRNLRQQVYQSYPALVGKILFRKRRKDFIEVVIQNYDEIIPKIHFKTIDKFSELVKAA